MCHTRTEILFALTVISDVCKAHTYDCKSCPLRYDSGSNVCGIYATANPSEWNIKSVEENNWVAFEE